MRHHRLCAFGAALLLSTATAWAESPPPEKRNGAPESRYPASTEVDQVLSLAHELEEASSHTYRTARSSLSSLDKTEEKALRKLEQLADRTRRFHLEVQKNRQDPSHTQDDFQDLVHSYIRARDAVHGDLNTASQVRDDFRRVEALVERLTGFYGGVGYYERTYPGYFGMESH